MRDPEEIREEIESLNEFCPNGEFLSRALEKEFENYVDEVMMAKGEDEAGVVRIHFGRDFLTFDIYRLLKELDPVALGEIRSEWAQEKEEELKEELRVLER